MQIKIIMLLIGFFVFAGCSTLSTIDERVFNPNKYSPHIEMYHECNIFDHHGIKQQPVYSGSRNALSYIVLPWTCSGEACFGALFYPVYIPYSLIDFTFSAIADTMALPYTYKLQYSVCPNVNSLALDNKRRLLMERIQLYYSDYSNPEHIWGLSSTSFKGKMSKDEFIKFIRDNNVIVASKANNFISETTIIDKNEARVLMHDVKYTILPWYDYWHYEEANWYIDKPNRKTGFTLLLEKQGQKE